MPNDFTFQDNSSAILEEIKKRIETALVEIGSRAQTYAVALTPTDTGRLKNSITYTTRHHSGKTINYLRHKSSEGKTTYTEEDETVTAPDENTLYLGTNVYYAPYIEFGTGIYADSGTGRDTPWSWTDRDGEKHPTKGIKPKHMLKKAIEDHTDEYMRVIKDHLKNG